MLAVEPFRSVNNERESAMQGSSTEEREFGDVGDDGENLLDIINFDDLLVGIGDGDVVPDLEMDHEFFAEFSASESETKIESENNGQDTAADSVSVSDAGLETSGPVHEPKPKPEPKPVMKNRVSKEADRSKKSTTKKKAKVDWTPELHRRFVEAVEQLGIDKAVPSRILEIMGIDCLTRHNIASHLQKYRSHRKHVQTRESEAASWARRRQMYGTAAVQREANPWLIAPTLGYPPTPHFRPLHVWGHPSVDQSLMHTWHKHVAPSPHVWPSPPLPDPSFWHPHHQYILPPATLFSPPPQFPPQRFPSPPAAQTLPQPPTDVHPSKESIDAAIGDILKKPWLPLPLGLKPPSMDSVMVELCRQGVSKIPLN